MDDLTDEAKSDEARADLALKIHAILQDGGHATDASLILSTFAILTGAYAEAYIKKVPEAKEDMIDYIQALTDEVIETLETHA